MARYVLLDESREPRSQLLPLEMFNFVPLIEDLVLEFQDDLQMPCGE